MAPRSGNGARYRPVIDVSRGVTLIRGSDVSLSRVFSRSGDRSSSLLDALFFVAWLSSGPYAPTSAGAVAQPTLHLCRSEGPRWSGMPKIGVLRCIYNCIYFRVHPVRLPVHPTVTWKNCVPYLDFLTIAQSGRQYILSIYIYCAVS